MPENKLPKTADNKYAFHNFSNKELYLFARNIPSDTEASEKEVMIQELATRMFVYARQYDEEHWDNRLFR